MRASRGDRNHHFCCCGAGVRSLLRYGPDKRFRPAHNPRACLSQAPTGTPALATFAALMKA